MTENPPPLRSPVAGFEVRAVLDQDEVLTVGLALDAAGERAVLLMANHGGQHRQRQEFLEWATAISGAAKVAPIAPIAGFGHTDDGRPYFASRVATSLADHLRLIGQPPTSQIRGMGASVADALATIHSYGLVHAAVSPATVLLFDRGVRLGGFGATAPGLTCRSTLWAFTAPEHRSAAVSGDEVGSPAADVFALAATICVALAGVLPWSDPTTWADIAEVPKGKKAPRWAIVLRSALAANPDLRPSAEEFAAALRLPAPEPVAAFDHAKVDLRGLIPRGARRLAAASVDAMSDAVMPARGRVSVPNEQVKMRRTRRFLREHRAGIGIAACLIALIAAYEINDLRGDDNSGRAAANVTTQQTTATLLVSARDQAQTFLHEIGIGDAIACSIVNGNHNFIVPASTATTDCTDVVADHSSILSAQLRDSLKQAQVTQAVQISTGSEQVDSSGSAADLQAFVSLAYVPALQGLLTRLEITMDYHDNQWWVIQMVLQ